MMNDEWGALGRGFYILYKQDRQKALVCGAGEKKTSAFPPFPTLGVTDWPTPMFGYIVVGQK